MNNESMNRAANKARDFLKAVQEVKNMMDESECNVFYGCKETAAVKRRSMDLTRALAEMRKS